MKVIPSIDLLKGKVVRLYQGDFNKVTVYYDDPLKALEMIVSNGGKRIHIVDLDGARKGESNNKDQINREGDAFSLNYSVIKKMISKFGDQIDFQVGGGIRSINDVEKLLEIGVDKVVIGSLIFTDYDVYREIVRLYGSQIILALDVKDGSIKRNGWQVDTNISIKELIKAGKIGDVYAVMSTDIAVDGALTGPNIDMMEDLNQTNIRWIASGGITSRADLEALSHIDLYGAILGKAIFEGFVEDLSDL
jgi:Phosphoribosylformimino-5-aminoimidazole carboxamide ribonucleotide (ProFAR) isomerase